MWWRASLLVVAAAAAVLPLSAAHVESLYSTRLFPVVQRVLTTASNRAPFPLFDGLVILVGAWWLTMTIRDVGRARRTGRLRAFARVIGRTATVVAASYLMFLLIWGLNYRRAALVDKLLFDPARVGTDRGEALASEVVERLNILYEPAHRAGWRPLEEIDDELAGAFATVQKELGLSGRTVPGRPKRSLFDVYFVKAGVAGMTDPYFLETLAASDLLPFERPFVVAHEWSHLAGFGDEGEANFVGWLTCVRGADAHRYSAWLFLYRELLPAIGPVPARTVADRLAAGPRDDLGAIEDRMLANINPWLSGAGWRVYDRYLKANRVDKGSASYGDVVRLLLGTEFSGEWVPRLR
jgi:hypothetical protein